MPYAVYSSARHANDPTAVLHIQFDCPVRSDTKGHMVMEFIAAKHGNEFSLFNIASVRETGSKVKVSSSKPNECHTTIGHWHKSWSFKWNFVSLFLGFEVSHRF